MKSLLLKLLVGTSVFMTCGRLLAQVSVTALPPDPKQVSAMSQWSTPEFVKARFEAEENRYCQGTVDGDICQLNHDDALETGCVTPEYSTMIRTISHSSGVGYYPICQVYARNPKRSVLTGFCKCGCFDPSTNILAIQKGQYQWIAAQNLAQSGADALSVPNQNFFKKGDGARFSATQFSSFVGPQMDKDLMTIKMGTGRELKVTSEHVVLLSNGKVIAAGDLQTSDALVDTSGNPVTIETIDRQRVELAPHNFSVNPESLNPKDHFIVAEGVIVGDESFQNGLSNIQGRVLARTSE